MATLENRADAETVETKPLLEPYTCCGQVFRGRKKYATHRHEEHAR